jgi:hypothetical protein
VDNSTYDIWASRIDQAIRKKLGSDAEVRESEDFLTLKDLLLSFAAEAKTIVGAITRNTNKVSEKISDARVMDVYFINHDQS